jgi:hypothetical protein
MDQNGLIQFHSLKLVEEYGAEWKIRDESTAGITK